MWSRGGSPPPGRERRRGEGCWLLGWRSSSGGSTTISLSFQPPRSHKPKEAAPFGPRRRMTTRNWSVVSSFHGNVSSSYLDITLGFLPGSWGSGPPEPASDWPGSRPGGWWLRLVLVACSVLDQREDGHGPDPLRASQLLQLYDHHALQDPGLQLLQQLAGSEQRPCDTRVALP